MRRVTVLERVLVEKKWTTQTRCHGHFHEWGVDYEEFDANAGMYTVAIVELFDGQVITVLPNLIQFVEPTL